MLEILIRNYFVAHTTKNLYVSRKKKIFIIEENFFQSVGFFTVMVWFFQCGEPHTTTIVRNVHFIFLYFLHICCIMCL